MAGQIEQKINAMATREAYGKALLELGRINSNVVVLDADLSGSTQTKFFAKEFPERFFNMGIAEANMISTAAGLARAGKIPFASSFAMFATGRAWEQVRNSVAHNRVNVKICATHAGITVGEDGASHQIVEDIAIMRVIPGMTVIVPADAEETRQAMTAIAEYDGPVYLRLGRPAVQIIYDTKYQFKIGKADILKEGKDISIFATGIAVSKALEASKELENQGISAEIINVSSMKPLDLDTIIRSIQKTSKAVTVEEHSVIGALGDAVAAAILENCQTSIRFAKIGIRDCFGQSGKAEELLEYYGISTSNIVLTAKKILS